MTALVARHALAEILYKLLRAIISVPVRTTAVVQAALSWSLVYIGL